MSGLSNVKYCLTKRDIEHDDKLVEHIFSKAKDSDHVFEEHEVQGFVNAFKMK